MEKGLVSVITPTYNCAKFIGETIEVCSGTNVSAMGNDYC